MILTEAALADWLARILMAHGLLAGSAAIIARVVAAAERDGATSHGVFRMQGYVSSLDSGWVDGAAMPLVEAAAPALLRADGRNGFSQLALAAARDRLAGLARSQGIAALAIRNAHHFAALWPDVEGFAEQGLIAIAMANTRSLVAPHGGRTRLFGTNPMAFACPRADGPPLVWDQASSTMAHGELQLARREGRRVPAATGVDRHGVPSTDPSAILDGGALSPFGGHKGSAIALMVEVLAAALTGGEFGFEDASGQVPGGVTSRGGQLYIVIDPGNDAGPFASRVAALLGRIEGNGAARIPGSRRLRHRARSAEQGIALSGETMEMLARLGPGASGLGVKRQDRTTRG